ncbi:MAG: NAD(P)/FAD-dependent oxidoreductase [Candidatus Paceibacterales bacterium]
MEKIFETIIVGAGPAGLTVGRYLEDALILEKEKEIGRPVQCAEGLTKRALERQEIESDPSWVSAVLDSSQVILPNGKIVTLSIGKAGFVLDRINFEKFLAQKCKAKIRLQQRVKEIERENGSWRVKTERGDILKSKYLIGADGPTSIVRRKVFKEKVKILPLIQYLVKLQKDIDTTKIKMYFDKERFCNGYAWIFPKSKNTANIGLGTTAHLQESFEDFMENTVKKELGPYELLENRSGAMSWGGAKIKLFKDNAFLVGDAGGLVDPIFGGGINNAMISGKIAAESILSAKPHLYESKIKSISFFSKDLLTVQKIVYSFDNRVLNEIGDILEKKGGDILYLKTFPAFFDLLSKPNLRKNILKFLKVIFIYHKHAGSWL